MPRGGVRAAGRESSAWDASLALRALPGRCVSASSRPSAIPDPTVCSHSFQPSWSRSAERSAACVTHNGSTPFFSATR
jgi:hypothetical protein